MRVRDYIWLALIIILIALYAYERFSRNPILPTVATQHDTLILHDTIRIVAKGRILQKVIDRIVTIRDTVRVQDTTGYVSCVDTTQDRAHVSVCYEYPANTFAIDISYAPDTVRLVTVVEKPLFRYEQHKQSVWWDIAKIAGGVVIGYTLGRMK